MRVRDCNGDTAAFDHAVIATHGDQALAILADPTGNERRLLGAFGYSRNTAVLHSDPALMPRRRAVWSSWNHIGGSDDESAATAVTYWMNSLQNIPDDTPLFVTLIRDGSRATSGIAKLTGTRYSILPQFGRNGSCGRCKAATTLGFADPISGQASMRTGCRPDLPSRKRWAACVGRVDCGTANKSGPHCRRQFADSAPELELNA